MSAATPRPHKKGSRQAYFEETGDFLSAIVYDGEIMEVGNVIEGPAIVELVTTTIVVPPHANLEVTAYVSFLIELTR